MDGVELHSLHWENFNPRMLEAHQRVMKHFGIPLIYHRRTIEHDLWLDQTAKASTADVLGFIEPDAIPLNSQAVPKAIEFVRRYDTLLGCAQVSNQFYPPTHIYAAPSFFFITRSCYERLGKPSFRVNARSDAGEEVSYAAECRGLRYRTLFPTHYEREPDVGVWPLGNYGWFGVGTVFDGQVYHLFQGRLEANWQLFEKRCDEVVAGTFSTQGFHSSTELLFPDRPVKFAFPPWSRPRRLVNRLARELATRGFRFETISAQVLHSINEKVESE